MRQGEKKSLLLHKILPKTDIVFLDNKVVYYKNLDGDREKDREDKNLSAESNFD
jgi:hypothetical protein